MKLKLDMRIFMFLPLILLLTLFGCNAKTTTETTTAPITTIAPTTSQVPTTTSFMTTTQKVLTGISVDEATVDSFYDVFVFDIREIYLELNYSDDSYSRIPVNPEWLSSGDLDLLTLVGVHTITISYQEFSVELVLDLRDVRVFRVTFKDYNDYIIDVQFIGFGEDAEEPEVLERPGYTFSGWNQEFTDIENDLLVYAQYDPIFYQVNFNSEGGSECNTVENVLYYDVIELPETTRTGYVFLGWYLGLEADSERFYSDSKVTGNIVLYAHWEEVLYDFTYLEMDAGIIITGLYYYVETLIIPDSIKDKAVIGISEKAFINNNNIDSIILPDSLTFIGDYAFMNCTSLTVIVLPNSLESIGVGAFANNTALSSFSFGSGINKIGVEALDNTPLLATIVIPNNLISIGTGAFTTTKWYLDHPDNTLIYIGKILIGYKGSMPIGYEANINLDTLAIADRAFKDQTNLYGVMIPDGLISVGELAFYNCASLAEIYLPSSVTFLGKHVFDNCTSMTIAQIEASIDYIPYGAFWDCSSLIDLTIPDDLTRIEAYAFAGCSSLTSFIVADSVTMVDYFAFSGASNLTSLTIGSGLSVITSSAFSNMNGLTDLVIPNTVTWINAYAFSGCTNLENLTLSANLTYIGYEAFKNCKYITEITLPGSMIYLGGLAFSGCTNLVTVTLEGYVPMIIFSNSFSFSSLDAKIFVPTESFIKYLVEDSWSDYTEFLTA